jgi:hypothetical protein
MEDNKMSDLTNLVPPLELCKLIPAGEFQDSALVWRVPNCSFPEEDEFYEIHERDKCESWMKDKQIPAPTLQEIMEVLPHDDACNDLLIGYSEKVEKFTGWHIYYIGDRKRHCYDKSAVTAALKLWLKMKGFEE